MAVRQSPPGRDEGLDSWASSPAIRRTMLGNRRRDTAPELVIRRLLHARGLRYRVDWPLPFDKRRRADIAFTKQKVAIFIDGCFWHGCPEHYIPPRANSEYWAEKVAGNAARDRDTDRRLRDLGWTVARFWEHHDPNEIAKVVQDLIAEKRDPLHQPRGPSGQGAGPEGSAQPELGAGGATESSSTAASSVRMTPRRGTDQDGTNDE